MRATVIALEESVYRDRMPKKPVEKVLAIHNRWTMHYRLSF